MFVSQREKNNKVIFVPNEEKKMLFCSQREKKNVIQPKPKKWRSPSGPLKTAIQKVIEKNRGSEGFLLQHKLKKTQNPYFSRPKMFFCKKHFWLEKIGFFWGGNPFFLFFFSVWRDKKTFQLSTKKII